MTARRHQTFRRGGVSRRSWWGTIGVGWSLVVLALVTCGPEAPPVASTEITEWTVADTPLTVIGEAEGEATHLFASVADVELLADGGVVVADRGTHSVRRFAPDGTFMWEAGGEGEGPGEYGFIVGTVVTSGDTTLVWDGGLGRLTRLGPDGSLAGTLAVRTTGGPPDLHLGRTADGGSVFVWIRRDIMTREGLVPDPMAAGRFAADGALRTTLVTGPGIRRLDGQVLPFSAHFLAALVGDTLIVTDGSRPELRVVGPDGSEMRRFDLPVEAVPAATARDTLSALLGPADATRLDELPGGPATDSVPYLAELLSAPSGELWVKVYDPATDNHWQGRRRTGGRWLVVGLDGEARAWVTIPEGVRLLAVHGDRIAGRTRDALGVEQVVVYPLRQRPPTSR